MNHIEIQTALASLTSWSYESNGIEKVYLFKNFSQALDFIIKVGALAEKLHHHPEIYNSYNKVKLRLTTHDAHGLTHKDFELAAAIDLV